MPTEMHTKGVHRESSTLPAAMSTGERESRTAALRQLKRVRRLKINLAAWVMGTILVTALWVLYEWQANGAFQRFAHEGNPGDWNPTLWAVVVGLWGLVVGIMALRVYFERPVTAAEVDREARRSPPQAAATDAPAGVELRHHARVRLEQIRRLRFHVAAWVLAMAVLTPLNVLIEWQDNGGFKRLSSNSQPGSWDPWVLRVGAIWALVIAAFALWTYVDGRRRGRLKG